MGWSVRWAAVAGWCVVSSMTLAADAKPKPAENKAGTEAIGEYFRRTLAPISAKALADVRSREDWERIRPQLKEQILEMLGLSPLPAKTDLVATKTGEIAREGIVVEKLHFQSLPNLYVTANFYRPAEVKGRLPTILYLCGHSRQVKDGVSYGNKTNYQHHAIWYAKHSYCCLVLDTLQLGEIEGIHHGTFSLGMWWWLARGYTPAGVEAWNAVRAIDYLETRPEVDAKKIGVTGRSGGGIGTWWVAAVDERPVCFVPVAGLTDLENHINDQCSAGHCDCNYFPNLYRWDYSIVASLAAPRPLLLSNTDKDPIFPLSGVERVHGKIRPIYQHLGADNQLGLFVCEGAHVDFQELQVASFRWMNRWLKGTTEPIDAAAPKLFTLEELKVLPAIPADQLNTTIHETFVPKAEPPPVPANRSDWETLRQELLARLRERSTAGWPESPAPVELKRIASSEKNGVRLEHFEFLSEENLRIPAYVIQGTKHAKPSLLVVRVVDEEGWKRWQAILSPFAEIVGVPTPAATDEKEFTSNAQMMDRFDWAFAIVPPRGVGPTAWNAEKKADTQIRRRFPLLGRTLDDGRIWDIRRAIQSLSTWETYQNARLWLEGEDAGAGIALYAGIFEPKVERMDLHRLPASHRDGPILLNVLRVYDMPQALALTLPRKAVLYDVNPDDWKWSDAVAKLYDAAKPPIQFRQMPKRNEGKKNAEGDK